MIFDDHEVTDDWYLNGRWCQTALKPPKRRAPLGRRVIRNALTAYALFQAWGNNPYHFSGGKSGEAGGQLLATVDEIASTAPDKASHLSSRVESLLGLPDLDDAVLDQERFVLRRATTAVKWHFQVPGSCHRAVVLDTRTRRHYPPRAKPGLIAPDQLSAQLGDPEDVTSDLVNVVISPAPIVDLEGIALIKKRAGDIPEFPLLDPAVAVDDETWVGNPPALLAFLDRLAAFDRVVILSGDVHYGFAGAIIRQDPMPRRVLANFTASALKNEVTAELFQRRFVSQVGASRLPLYGEGRTWILESVSSERMVTNDPASARVVVVKNHLGELTAEVSADGIVTFQQRLYSPGRFKPETVSFRVLAG